MHVRDRTGPPPSYAASWEWFYALHFDLGWSGTDAFRYIKWMTRGSFRYYGNA